MSDDLWQEYRASKDEDLRNRLVLLHLPLVRYLASKMLPGLHSSVELQDLVSWGTFGLIDAVERYDPDSGNKFSTFATYRITGSINDEMRSQAWEPRSVRAKFRQIVLAETELERELGRTPTEEEVATRVGADPGAISRARADMDTARVGSLSFSAGDQDDDQNGRWHDGGWATQVTALELGDVGHEFEELSATVATAITKLGEQDRVLFEWVYVQRRPFKDIAATLGVTESWVSHLHTRGLVRLQRVLSARY